MAQVERKIVWKKNNEKLVKPKEAITSLNGFIMEKIHVQEMMNGFSMINIGYEITLIVLSCTKRIKKMFLFKFYYLFLQLYLNRLSIVSICYLLKISFL